jgi:hypothetical protein
MTTCSILWPISARLSRKNDLTGELGHSAFRRMPFFLGEAGNLKKFLYFLGAYTVLPVDGLSLHWHTNLKVGSSAGPLSFEGRGHD